MVTLSTPRMHLIALDLENLYHYVHHYGQVQENLGVVHHQDALDWETQYAFREAHYQALNDPENILWYTSWEMVLLEENRIIGGICFKGPPDEKGEVEVGYGTDEPYWNKGLTIEALTALFEWALSEHNIKAFIASTELDNIASQNLLKKLGFEQYEENRGLIWWRLNVEKIVLD